MPKFTVSVNAWFSYSATDIGRMEVEYWQNWLFGGIDRERSYAEAVDWYETVVNTTNEDDSGEFDATMDDPVYQLQAAMAQLYLVGGYGLEKDPSYAGMTRAFTCSSHGLKCYFSNN